MQDKELFNSGKYTEIITKYSMNDQEGLDQWELFWLCKSFYKVKDFKKCNDVYKKYISKNPEKDMLINTDLWCYYQALLNLEELDENRFYKCAKYIISNCIQEDKYSPYSTTVFKVIKHIKSNTVNINYNLIYEWTGYLDPQSLSLEENIASVNGEEKRVASDKEKWYGDRSKACIKIGKYEECIKICEEALKEFEISAKAYPNVRFHNNNDIWLQSKIAKSKKMLGDLEDAKHIFSELILKNEHFALRSELAEIYEELNEESLSKRYYYEAALSYIGTPKGKINIIEKIGDALVKEGELQQGKMQYMFVKKIREEEEWKQNQTILNKLKELNGVECNIDEKYLYKQCKNIWNNKLMEYLPEGKGVIKNLIGNMKHGFIKADNEDIHFNIKNIINSSNNDIVNKSVSFNIIESYDNKKKVKSHEAVNIRLI